MVETVVFSRTFRVIINQDLFEFIFPLFVITTPLELCNGVPYGAMFGTNVYHHWRPTLPESNLIKIIFRSLMMCCIKVLTWGPQFAQFVQSWSPRASNGPPGALKGQQGAPKAIKAYHR